jgi:hypothetical protein
VKRIRPLRSAPPTDGRPQTSLERSEQADGEAANTLCECTSQHKIAKPVCCGTAPQPSSASTRRLGQSKCSAAWSSFFERPKVHRARKCECSLVFATHQSVRFLPRNGCQKSASQRVFKIRLSQGAAKYRPATALYRCPVDIDCNRCKTALCLDGGPVQTTPVGISAGSHTKGSKTCTLNPLGRLLS